jgi:anti-anti-sigma factor
VIEGGWVDERADDGLQVVAASDGLEARGEIDLDSAEQLTDAVVGAAGRVVLSLEGVTFIDSSGLRGLIQAQRTLQGRGDDLVLRRPSPVVHRLLEITGLLDEFTIEA